MKKNWILLPSPSPDKVSAISKELGISKIAAQILVHRGYSTPEKADEFLNPAIESLHDPFLLPQMDVASARIVKAIESQEKILVYGDYDVDGTTACAVLYRALKGVNRTPDMYVPHRTKEGHGITQKGMEYCIQSYVNLIITVDCGITEVDRINSLQSQGIDVVLTDHHEPRAELPGAVAVVDAKTVSGDEGNDLAGCGVAFKLAQAVYKRLGLGIESLLPYLDMVALATVCDVVPLVGENRVFARLGLEALQNTENKGLRGLLAVSGLDGAALNAYHLGFSLGPKMNAQGRLGDAKEVIRLLITEDGEEAHRIAQDLDEENKKRQGIQQETVRQALEDIERLGLGDKAGVVLAREGWHAGVIGVAASKIQDKWYRPMVLIALDGDVGRGSARSIPGFHLYNALSQCEKYLESYGGHKSAAGFVIRSDNIEPFRTQFEEHSSGELKPEDLIPKWFIDKEIDTGEINRTLVQEVERLAPFGAGNPRPLFLTRRVQVVGYPEILKKRHLRFRVRGKDGVVVKAIGFDLGHVAVSTGEYVDIVYELQEETWQGRSELSLRLRDVEVINT
jgi:single-stranded-DNA-specific exonuclease